MTLNLSKQKDKRIVSLLGMFPLENPFALEAGSLLAPYLCLACINTYSISIYYLFLYFIVFHIILLPFSGVNAILESFFPSIYSAWVTRTFIPVCTYHGHPCFSKHATSGFGINPIQFDNDIE